jgi:hypothetical protein
MTTLGRFRAGAASAASDDDRKERRSIAAMVYDLL